MHKKNYLPEFKIHANFPLYEELLHLEIINNTVVCMELKKLYIRVEEVAIQCLDCIRILHATERHISMKVYVAGFQCMGTNY